MRRLLSCKNGIDGMLGAPELGHGLVAYAWGGLEWSALDVAAAAMEALSALLHLRSDPVDLGQEQLCKRLVLDPPSRCKLLQATVETHLRCGTGALLRKLTLRLCRATISVNNFACNGADHSGPTTAI